MISSKMIAYRILNNLTREADDPLWSFAPRIQTKVRKEHEQLNLFNG